MHFLQQSISYKKAAPVWQCLPSSPFSHWCDLYGADSDLVPWFTMGLFALEPTKCLSSVEPSRLLVPPSGTAFHLCYAPLE